MPVGLVHFAIQTVCANRVGFRAQGRTVDTTHVYITAATLREPLYVMATRGRESNRPYVDTAYDPDKATSHDTPRTWTRVRFSGPSSRPSAGTSAHTKPAKPREQAHRLHGASRAKAQRCWSDEAESGYEPVAVGRIPVVAPTEIVASVISSALRAIAQRTLPTQTKPKSSLLGGR